MKALWNGHRCICFLSLIVLLGGAILDDHLDAEENDFTALFPALQTEQEWLNQPLAGLDIQSPGSGYDRLLKRYLDAPLKSLVTWSFIRNNIRRLYLSGYCESIIVSARKESDGVVLIFYCKPAYLVERIEIVGGYTWLPWLGPTKISRNDIVELLTIKEGLPFRDAQLEQSIKAIKKLFYDDGFWNCSVSVTPQFHESERTVTLTVTIDRGKPAHIVTYDIERRRVGIDALYEVFGQARFNRWKLSRFRLESFKKDLKKTERYYHKFGYYSARVSIKEMQYDKEKAEITMVLIFDPGPLLILDMVYSHHFWNFTWNIPWISDIRFLNAWFDFTPTELLPVLKRGTVNDRLLDKGSENLISIYKSKGYENVSVNVTREKTKDKKGERVTYRIDEGKPVLVERINISGAQAFSDSKIKGSMRIKEKSWNPLSRLIGSIRGDLNGRFVTDELSKDMEAIQSLYVLDGYRFCKVTGVPRHVSPERVHLDISIDEGVRTTFSRITLKGNEIIREADLRKAITLRPGDPFLQRAVDQARIDVLMQYEKKGFLSSTAIESIRITPTVTFHDYGQLADLELDIMERYQIWFDKPMVTGLTRTKSKVVTREIDFHHYDPYSIEKVLQTREKLYKLGIFKRVTFEERPLINPYFMKTVIWNVEEKNSGSLDFGGGWNSKEGFRVFGTLSDRNFFNNAQYIGLNASVNQDATKSSVELLFRDRYFGNLPIELTTSVYRKFEHQPNFEIWSTGGTINFARVFHYFYRGSFEYRLQNIRGGQDLILLSDKETIDNFPRRISSVTPRFSVDTRDNPFLPESGYLSNLQVEFARDFLGSAADFTKLSFLGTSYMSLSTQSVLVTNVSLGLSKDLPIFERFRLGGPTTLRGYELDSVGPVNLLGQPDFGNTYILGNLEYRFPFIWGLGGQLFYDTGNLWMEPIGSIPSLSLVHSVGFGLRLDFSFGPLRFDVGYPIEDSTLGAPVFSFNLGHPF